MIYHNQAEVVPGFTLDAVFTNGWSNETYRSGLSILRNHYPIRSPKDFTEIDDSAIIIKRADDSNGFRMSIIADYNSFDSAKIARCASTIATKVIELTGGLAEGVTREQIVEDCYRAINRSFTKMSEDILFESGKID